MESRATEMFGKAIEIWYIVGYVVPQSLALDELTLETEDKWKILSKLKTWGLVRRLRREQRTEESRQLVWPEHQETGAQMRDQAGVAGATQFKVCVGSMRSEIRLEHVEKKK